jgi:hypothetical protein
MMNSPNSSNSHVLSASGGDALSNSSQPGEVIIGRRCYLTAERLAEVLDVSPRTVARWNAERIGPPRIRVGKLILFDVVKLHNWLEAYEVEPVRLPLRRCSR